MKSNQLIIPVAIIFMLSSCGNNSNEAASAEKAAVITIDSANLETKQKIYSLPSAMQVSTFLKTVDGKYHEDFLKGNMNPSNASLTTTQKALSLGIFGVDLGYTISYNQEQSSIIYLVKIAKISDDLKISGAFKKETINRFKNNITNTDSLTYIALSSFNDANIFLINNNNKDVQYLIGAGSLIEGLYLIASVQKLEKKQENANVIGMQKLYLNNLLELLSPYSEKQPDVKEAVAKLERIKKALEIVNVEIITEADGSSKTIKDVELNDKQLENILKEVVAVRESIIG